MQLLRASMHGLCNVLVMYNPMQQIKNPGKTEIRNTDLKTDYTPAEQSKR